MKRKRRLDLFCILLLGAVALIGFHQIVQAAPFAHLAESTFNFGSAIEGSKIEHDFVMKNNGTEPLVIEKIRTG